MKKWVRRIRAAVGLGLTWGAAWFGAGLILLLVVGVGAADVPFPLFFGLLGFLAGVTFSGVLGVFEGRRGLHQMSLPRFAGWGAVGGLVFSGIFVVVVALGGETLWGEILVLGPVFTLAGAASAAGSLALARMAERRELPDPSADPAGAGLTEDERRELLGGGD
jgi:hypothetical protein